MVSMKDIAQACGVSVASVSKALNNHTDIGEETRQLIRRTAKDLCQPEQGTAQADDLSGACQIPGI